MREAVMRLVRVRGRGESELRDALAIREGDTLAAEAVEGGVLLKPVSPAKRKAAWERSSSRARFELRRQGLEVTRGAPREADLHFSSRTSFL